MYSKKKYGSKSDISGSKDEQCVSISCIKGDYEFLLYVHKFALVFFWSSLHRNYRELHCILCIIYGEKIPMPTVPAAAAAVSMAAIAPEFAIAPVTAAPVIPPFVVEEFWLPDGVALDPSIPPAAIAAPKPA